MSDIKPNLNQNLDINYLVICYLKIVLPTWVGDSTDLNRIMQLLGQEIMGRVQNECTQIKQQCVQNPEIVSYTLILPKALALRKDKEHILKPLQQQI